MTLDHEICYRAVASRDTRFDGQFFTGIATTGVYCRPVCPSRTPKRENARFFRCAAEAEQAGYRPCLRCRPETSPGSPAWAGTRASVSKALRFISTGYLDDHSVDELADRLGLGGRHLRRLFSRHLGASPLHVAQTRRLHFARRLLTGSRIPVSEVAFASGFGSLRQFNDLFHRVYRQPPMELRNRRPGPVGLSEVEQTGAGFEFKLFYRPPFPWPAAAGFLEPRATPGVECVQGDRYRRSVRAGGSVGLVEVEPALSDGCLLLRIRVPVARGLIRVVDRVRGMFDLAADPAVIGGHLRQDRWLAPLVGAVPGLRVPGAWDAFELAVRAIVGQQISVKAATRATGLLVERFGQLIAAPESAGITHIFPTAQSLAAADVSDFRMPAARAEAIVGLARAVCEGRLSLERRASLDDAVDGLTALRGIGDWTAHYIAMRGLGEPDAFPASDLGLLGAAAVLGRSALTASALRDRAESWRPWRAYAAMYLWNSLSRPPVGTR